MRALSDKLGLSVISPEYPGYSINQSQCPSESVINKSLSLVLHYIKNTLGFPVSKIIVFGRSLGCSFALNLGKRKRIHSIILVAPFYNMRTVFTYKTFILGKLVNKDSFRNDVFI